MEINNLNTFKNLIMENIKNDKKLDTEEASKIFKTIKNLPVEDQLAALDLFDKVATKYGDDTVKKVATVIDFVDDAMNGATLEDAEKKITFTALAAKAIEAHVEDKYTKVFVYSKKMSGNVHQMDMATIKEAIKDFKEKSGLPPETFNNGKILTNMDAKLNFNTMERVYQVNVKFIPKD